MNELVWLIQLLKELRLGKVTQMTLIRDNQVALHITSNSISNKRIKHVEIYCHYIHENILSLDNSTQFVNINDQFACLHQI